MTRILRLMCADDRDIAAPLPLKNRDSETTDVRDKIEYISMGGLGVK